MSTEKTEHNKFTQLPPQQIEKLRDAFQLIDQDNDGSISKEDLSKTYESISQGKNDEEIDKMLGSSDVIFTGYLSLISNELGQLPNKTDIQRALDVLAKDGEINVKELEKNLLAVGMKRDEFCAVIDAFKRERMDGEQVFLGQDFMNYVSS